jgi:tetratricopeptide (TPR) repeat protein
VIAVLVSATLSFNALSRAKYENGGPDISPALAPGAVAAARTWSFDPHLAYLASSHARLAGAADPSGGWGPVAMGLVERAAQLDPLEPFYALERARAYKYGGLPEDRVDAAFEDAFALYPAFPVARAEYAGYLAQVGRVDEAIAQLDAISRIDDGDPEREAAVRAAQAAIATAR